ncbi:MULTISPECIES: SDR family oxidoreductase [unclassified Mycolicibacterium]
MRKLPVGHIGAPEDVAAAIVFLASDLAKQVTGSRCLTMTLVPSSALSE